MCPELLRLLITRMCFLLICLGVIIYINCFAACAQGTNKILKPPVNASQVLNEVSGKVV